MTQAHDNYGRPRQEYMNRLERMDGKTLQDECEQRIWLSSYAANNPRSDYHWQVEACYVECDRRNHREIYEQAYKVVERSVRGY